MTEKLFDTIGQSVFGELKSCMVSLGAIAVTAFVCSLVKGFELDGRGNREITHGVFLVEYVIIASFLCTSLIYVKEIAENAINSMVGIMNGVYPALLTSYAAFGNAAAAAGMSPVFIVATEIVTNLLKLFFLPAAIIMAVLCFADNLSEKIKISNLVSFVKNGVIWGLGIIMTLYIALLTVQGFVARSSEGAVGKTVRFAVGSLIPILGQYLSDSVNAVASSAAAINSAAGAGAMTAIIIAAAGPFFKILVNAGLIKLTAAIVQPVSDDRITKCISGTASSISLISGLTAVCGMIFTVTLGSALSVINAIATGG